MKKTVLATFSWATLAASLLFGSTGVNAFPASETEMALIPSYCKDTQGFGYGDATSNPSPRSGHWVSLMGKTFWHMHHYCAGLIKRNRAMKAGMRTEERKHLLGSAIQEYEYILDNNKDPDFILLPEVYTRLGEANILIANPLAAEKAFEKARQIKADYWPAYSHWAEYLIQKGKKAEAKQLVKNGLEQTPNAKVLIEQYRLLGGKPSDIVPVVKKPVVDEEEEETKADAKKDAEPSGPKANGEEPQQAQQAEPSQ